MADPTATEPQKAGAGVLLHCWECRTPLTGEESPLPHFCSQCGKVQPLPAQADYFSFFGLPRKLGLDEEQLERQFHQLSWQLHPDRFHQASGYEQELSLERTALLNDAYRTLREPVARVEYLLRLEEVRKEGDVKQRAPADLLEEVFELNEYLEELRAAKRSGGERREQEELRHRLEKARETFQQKLEDVLEELTAQFAEWDKLVADPATDVGARRAVLKRLNEILNRHSYIRNLVANVSEELEA